ncbi:MAG TPA: MmpS family transport accessory protein [Mycobacterium sp.]
MPRLLAVLTAVATAVPVCGLANATPEKPQVTYQLSGSAPVADYISYQTADGQIQQARVPLPFTTKFTSFGYQQYLISAQSPGSVTCTILVDGKVVSQATANGAPARTVCSH